MTHRGIPLVLLGLLALTSCADDSAASDDPGEPAGRRVAYQVEGDAPGAAVTLRTPTGLEQADVALPLVDKAGQPLDGIAYTFLGGEPLYISAQNESDTGSVTCRILVDGRVISENTSTADYGIASCDGRS